MSGAARPSRQRHPSTVGGIHGLTCPECNTHKSLDEFTRRSRAKSGYDTYCKDCQRWRMKLHHYGLTKEDYTSMLERQGGVCAICRCRPSDSTHGHLVVDHCHSTGAVRGLLCSACNTAIGMIKDNKVLASGAVRYLGKALEPLRKPWCHVASLWFR